MSTDNAPPAEARAPREQIVYANLLTLGVWTGIFLLLVTYTLYLSGIVAPKVPLEEVPGHWGNGVDEYLAATGTPQGWGWTGLLGRGDFLNFLGFALLGLTTVICYTTLIARFAKTRSRVLLVICTLELVVLCVAASGLLGSGGH